MPIGSSYTHVDTQPIAILHEKMPGIREHSGAASLSSQLGLRVRRGLMRVVGTLFPVEIAGWIASTLRWIAVVIAFGLGPEALQGSPGLHQAGRDCARNQRGRMSRHRPASPERSETACRSEAARRAGAHCGCCIGTSAGILSTNAS